MMQKRILDFIEIIGGIFLAISLLLRVQFDMKVPAWITIICILIVTVTFCLILCWQKNWIGSKNFKYL